MSIQYATNPSIEISRQAPRRSVSTVLVALFLMAIAVGCRKQETTPPTEVEVQASTAQEAGITEHMTADAILSPLAQAAIAPKISAPVQKFFVQRGSKVKEGELLATLENRDLEAAALDNRGSYDAAQATYQTTTKALVPEDSQKAELDMLQAKANLNLDLKIVESRKQLFAAGAIPGRDLDTAEATLVQAQAAFDLAQQHLNSMRQVSREAALKSAQGQLESARGKYLGAEAQLKYSEVRSPIAGVVTDRPLFPGETAVIGVPLLTVMDISSLLAKMHMPQSQTQWLRVGDAASVNIPGMEDPVEGKVAVVSPALDPGSTTVEVWVRISNTDNKLRPGTAVHISIAGKSVPKAVVVPVESIVTEPTGKKTVMVLGADGVAHQREVMVGIEDHGFIQILQGVSSGEKLITKGAYALDDGTKVKVVIASDKDTDADKASGSGVTR